MFLIHPFTLMSETMITSATFSSSIIQIPNVSEFISLMLDKESEMIIFGDSGETATGTCEILHFTEIVHVRPLLHLRWRQGYGHKEIMIVERLDLAETRHE